MDLEDLAPAGATLRRPVLGPHRRVVATFTPTRTPDPSELWEPFTRTNDRTRDGQQGNPFGRPGHGIEHEPLDQDEKASGRTVQFDHAQTASSIRAALRPGIS